LIALRYSLPFGSPAHLAALGVVRDWKNSTDKDNPRIDIQQSAFDGV
jgi:hypothetical protein